MKASKKDNFKEIKNTFSRFISILLIVGLGVFVLIGLICTGPIMRKTLDKAINKSNYQDICVSAPSGLEDEDMKIIENQDGLDELEYAYDIDLSIKGRTEVIKVMNMPLKINMPNIIEGKPPRKGQILLDKRLKELSYKIGDKISFATEVNKMDENEGQSKLKNYSYEVSGFCNSLDYIMNRTRGYSQRGLGEIHGFAYIDAGEFNDKPTIARLIYKDSKKYDTSDKEYKNLISSKFQSLKIDMRYRPSNRLEKIKGNISDDIKNGEGKIADARMQLINAKDKLERGRNDLKKGQDQYEKGLKEFQSQKKEGQDKLTDSKYKLSKAKGDLNKADKDLKEGKKKLDNGKKDLNDAKSQIDENREKLQDGYRKYENGKGQLKAGEEALSEGEKQLADGRKKLDDGWKKIEESKIKLQEGRIKYEQGLQEYTEGKRKLEESKGKIVETFNKMGISNVNYDQAQSLIITMSSALDRLSPLIDQSKGIDEQISQSQKNIENYQNQKNKIEADIESLNKEIADEKDVQKKQELSNTLEFLKNQKNQINSDLAKENLKLQTLKKTKEEIDKNFAELDKILPGIGNIGDINSIKEKLSQAKDGVAKIQTGEKTLIEAKAKLDSSKTQLEEGEKQLQEGISEAEAGEAEYGKNEEKIKDNRKKIQVGKEELIKAKKDLDEGESKLKKGEKDYDDGLKKYDENYNKYVEGKAKYESGKKEYDEGQKAFVEGQKTFDKEIQVGQNKLNDAKYKLYKGKKDLAKGQSEFNDKSKDAEEKISKAENDIDKGKRYLNIIKEPRYSISPRYQIVDVNTYIDFSKRIDGLSLIFPIFFFAIALLVSFTTMTRMVEEERTIIGTYKALGYTDKEISEKYFIYGALASIIGGSIGAISGSYILTYVIGNAYSTDSIFEGNLIISPYPLKILFAIIVGFIFTALAAIFTANNSLRENTASLLRQKPPKIGNRILLERFPFIWKRMSFLFKVTARNLFRSKKRMFMTVIGIMGCTALLVLGFGIKGSVEDIEDLQFSQIIKYDLAISYDRDIDEDDFKNYKEFINNSSLDRGKFYQEQFTVEYPKMDQSLNLIVPSDIDDFSKFFSIRNPKTRKAINLDGRGAVISQKLSKLLHIKKGDILKIRDAYDNEFEVEVKDICEMYITHYIFMNKDYYEKIKGEKFTTNTDFIKNLNDKEMKNLKNKVINYKVVTSVVGADIFRKALNQFLYSIEKVEGIIVIMSSLLAIVVLYNLTNINIEERRREIATIKVLGFYAKETTAYVYRETFILTFLGIVIGLIVGKLLHYFILQIVVPYYVMLSEHLVVVSYIYASLITLFITIFIMIIFHFKIKKIDMVESLKSNE